jgi:hypothetical protein
MSNPKLASKILIQQNNGRSAPRKGAALVEFAVCLPVLMVLVLGSMEATSAIFVRQALTTSAYEGIREAVRPSGSTVTATNRAQAILTARGIRSSSIRLLPADIRNVPRGEPVTIEVSAPFAANSTFFGKVIADRTTTVRTVMTKE